jgi:hypothetical protein
MVGFGGAERDRTVDLLNAIQALSQLSYGPTMFLAGCPILRQGTGTNAAGASKFPWRAILAEGGGNINCEERLA